MRTSSTSCARSHSATSDRERRSSGLGSSVFGSSAGRGLMDAERVIAVPFDLQHARPLVYLSLLLCMSMLVIILYRVCTLLNSLV